MEDAFFYVEEHTAWIRSNPHTFVYENDPDFHRFVQDPTGTIKHILRIWLPKSNGSQPLLYTYLGSITYCSNDVSFPDISRLLHSTSKAAMATGQSVQALKYELTCLLRSHFNRSCHEDEIRKAKSRYKQIPSNLAWMKDVNTSILERADKVFRTNYGYDSVEADLRYGSDYYKICKNLQQDRHYYDLPKVEKSYECHLVGILILIIALSSIFLVGGLIYNLWVGILSGVVIIITSTLWIILTPHSTHYFNNKELSKNR